MSLGPPDATCQIFTFKDGLLSAVAHDLRLKVTRFTVAIDPSQATVTATFDTGSIAVDAVMRSGHAVPGVLTTKDFDKIAANIRDEVLMSRANPQAVFRAALPSAEARTSNTVTVRGDLTLKGTTRPVQVVFQRDQEAWVGRVRIHQPDFGIKPYSAMLGSLKVKADVDVEIRLPIAAVPAA